MGKIAVLTDSNSGITQEQAKGTGGIRDSDAVFY